MPGNPDMKKHKMFPANPLQVVPQSTIKIKSRVSKTKSTKPTQEQTKLYLPWVQKMAPTNDGDKGQMMKQIFPVQFKRTHVVRVHGNDNARGPIVASPGRQARGQTILYTQ